MRRLLPSWAVLLIGAILFVAGLFWIRSHPGQKPTPLEEAVETISQYLGMEVEQAPGPEGGLLVKGVRPGTMAHRLGVQVGEKVMAVGDRSVWHAVQLQQLINEEMQRRRGCAIMLAKDQTFRTVIFGFAPVPPPPTADEHAHY